MDNNLFPGGIQSGIGRDFESSRYCVTCTASVSLGVPAYKVVAYLFEITGITKNCDIGVSCVGGAVSGHAAAGSTVGIVGYGVSSNRGVNGLQSYAIQINGILGGGIRGAGTVPVHGELDAAFGFGIA